MNIEEMEKLCGPLLSPSLSQLTWWYTPESEIKYFRIPWFRCWLPSPFFPDSLLSISCLLAGWSYEPQHMQPYLGISHHEKLTKNLELGLGKHRERAFACPPLVSDGLTKLVTQILADVLQGEKFREREVCQVYIDNPQMEFDFLDALLKFGEELQEKGVFTDGKNTRVIVS